MNINGLNITNNDILNSELWLSNEPYDKRSAYIDLLLLRGKEKLSIHKLAKRWQWSYTTAFRFINSEEVKKIYEPKSEPLKPLKNTQDIGLCEPKSEPLKPLKNTQDIGLGETKSETPQKTSTEVDNFCNKYKKITGKNISRLSHGKLFNLAGNLQDILQEIQKSRYLTNNANIDWIIKNTDKVLEGKYRDYDLRPQKWTKFDNFSDKNSVNMDKIARKKRDLIFKRIDLNG